MNKSLLLISLIIFLIPTATATSLEFIGNCTDADTLVISMNYTFNETERFFEQRPIICPHGCTDGQGQYGDDCGPSPNEQNATNTGTAIAISIILSMIAFAFIYLALNLSKDNQILGWFFLPVSLFIMIVNVFVLTWFTVDVGLINILSVTGLVLIVAVILVIAYFMLFVMTKGFQKSLRQREQRNRFGEDQGV